MRSHLRLSLAAGVALCLCWLVQCGCGRGSQDPAKVASQYDRVFASADADSKALWETATSAMKTNGYAVTIESIRAMLVQGKLTPEQAKAAQATATAASDRMYDAANKGDASALQAIQDLRKAGSR